MFVFEGIKSGKNITQIAQELGITKQRLNYYISTLKRKGIITKKGYGVWEINPLKTSKKTSTHTSKPFKYGNFVLVEDQTRGHAFIFRVQLPKSLRNWDKREERIRQKHPELKPQQLNKGVRIEYRGRKIHLWDNSIVVYENNSYVADLATDTENKAIGEFISLMQGLSRVLKANFGKLRFTVPRKHFGLVKNALASYYRSRGLKEYVADKFGYWLTIDFSRLQQTSPYKVPELEVWSSKGHEATNTSEKLKEWWNDHKGNNFEVTASYTLNMFQELITDRKVHAKNMLDHVEAIRKLGNGVSDLVDEVKKLNKLNKRK